MSQQEPWLYAGNNAENFERYYIPAIFAPWAADLMALAAPQPGEHVLDVACGTGVVARLAAQHVGAAGTVIGLDISVEMLAVACSLPPRPGASIEWREASAIAMPLPDAAFDLVLCQQGLQFFPDQPAAVREMYRVLVPGGRVALSVWRSIEHNPGWAALAQALERHISPEVAGNFVHAGPFCFGNAEGLHALIAGAGFCEVKIEPAVKTLHFPSCEEFVRRAAAVHTRSVGVVAQVSGEVRAAFIRDVRTALQPYLSHAGLRFPSETNLATAKK